MLGGSTRGSSSTRPVAGAVRAACDQSHVDTPNRLLSRPLLPAGRGRRRHAQAGTWTSTAGVGSPRDVARYEIGADEDRAGVLSGCPLVGRQPGWYMFPQPPARAARASPPPPPNPATSGPTYFITAEVAERTGSEDAILLQFYCEVIPAAGGGPLMVGAPWRPWSAPLARKVPACSGSLSSVCRAIASGRLPNSSITQGRVQRQGDAPSRPGRKGTMAAPAWSGSFDPAPEPPSPRNRR